MCLLEESRDYDEILKYIDDSQWLVLTYKKKTIILKQSSVQEGIHYP